MATTKSPRRKARSSSSSSKAARSSGAATRARSGAGKRSGAAASGKAGSKPGAKPAKGGKAASGSARKAAAASAGKRPGPATAPKGRGRVAGELGGPNEALWREYARTRDPELRNQLMEMYLPVVQFIAERLLLTLPRSIDVDDLKSAGVFGLMDAIDGFDIDRAIKFKTYCSTRVRGAILDELRSQDWVPRLVRLRAHQLARTQAALEAVHGRTPTDAEMAGELGVPVHEFLAMQEESRAHTVRSLSEAWDDGSGDQPVEKIDFLRDPGSPDPADILNQEDVMRAIIRSLNRREKQIILMYYRDGLTMKQIGSLMTLTESRVCQIHSNVMKKLKHQLEESRERLHM